MSFSNEQSAGGWNAFVNAPALVVVRLIEDFPSSRPTRGFAVVWGAGRAASIDTQDWRLFVVDSREYGVVAVDIAKENIAKKPIQKPEKMDKFGPN